MYYAGTELPRDLVHVGNHQQQPLRGGKCRRQRAALQRAVDCAGGAGFGAARLKGSENNDPITPDGFASNQAGGILGGVSNGDDIILRAAVKPIPSLSIEQKTINTSRKPATISARGRHDVSAIPRINVVCEAMVYLVLADHFLRQRAIQ